MRGNKTEQTVDYFWHRHTALLDLVDLIEDNKLRKKLKTKILDVAHEVKCEIEDNSKEE